MLRNSLDPDPSSMYTGSETVLKISKNVNFLRFLCVFLCVQGSLAGYYPPYTMQPYPAGTPIYYVQGHPSIRLLTPSPLPPTWPSLAVFLLFLLALFLLPFSWSCFDWLLFCTHPNGGIRCTYPCSLYKGTGTLFSSNRASLSLLTYSNPSHIPPPSSSSTCRPGSNVTWRTCILLLESEYPEWDPCWEEG